MSIQNYIQSLQELSAELIHKKSSTPQPCNEQLEAARTRFAGKELVFTPSNKGDEVAFFITVFCGLSSGEVELQLSHPHCGRNVLLRHFDRDLLLPDPNGTWAIRER